MHVVLLDSCNVRYSVTLIDESVFTLAVIFMLELENVGLLNILLYAVCGIFEMKSATIKATPTTHQAAITPAFLCCVVFFILLLFFRLIYRRILPCVNHLLFKS